MYRPVSILVCSAFLFCGAGCSTKVKQLGNPDLTDIDSPSSGGEFQLSYALEREEEILLRATARSSSLFLSICGSGNSICRCELFADERDEEPSAVSETVKYYKDGNIIHCPLRRGTNTDVRIKDVFERLTTDRVPIIKIPAGDKSLSLEQVLGNAPVIRLRKIYRYECSLNYLYNDAADGTPPNICKPNGNLFFLQARFSYYLFNTLEDLGGNIDFWRPDILYRTPVCRSNDIRKKVSCGRVTTPEFGLYGGQRSEIFTTRVKLNAAPGQIGGGETQGYASRPYTLESDGTKVCPPGMEKRAYFKESIESIKSDGDDASKEKLEKSEPMEVDSLEDIRLEKEDFSKEFVLYESVGVACETIACNVLPEPPNSDSTRMIPTAGNRASYSKGTEEASVCVIKSDLLQ